MIRILLLMALSFNAITALGQSGTIQVDKTCPCVEIPIKYTPRLQRASDPTEGTGRIEGVVTIPTNGSIDPTCVFVRLYDGDFQIGQVCADLAGGYVFPFLDPGTYTVELGGKGLASLKVTQVRVLANSRTTVNRTLKAKAAEDSGKRSRKRSRNAR